MKDRDPNPLTSPHYQIERVVVADFTPFPELGLTEASVTAYLAARLEALKNEARPGGHGFTAAELDEIGRALAGMGLREGGELSAREAGELERLVRAQGARRGVSLVQLERLAAELTELYRRHGLPLATAYVPVQEVRQGVVELGMAPGRLAEVRVSGDARHPAALIREAFAPQIDEPVEHRRVESVLYLVNALPGLEAQSHFVAGEEVGTTELRLQIREESSITADVHADNYGSRQIGEQRVAAEIDWRNPTGVADSIGIGALAAFDPESSAHGYLEYSRPLHDIATSLHARIANTAYDWTDGDVDVAGDSSLAEIGVRHVLERSRVQSFAIDATLGWQTLELDSDTFGAVQDQELTVASFAASGARVLDSMELALDGRVGVDVGTYLDDDPAGSLSFGRLALDGFAWTMVGVPGMLRPQALSLHMSAQLSSEPLPATLQLPLGGATRVRGFDPSQVSADDALLGGLELRLAPWRVERYGEILLFGDAGWGKQKRHFDRDVSVELASVGIGWKGALMPGLETELRWSLPITAKGSDDVDDDGPELLWLFHYQPRGRR